MNEPACFEQIELRMLLSASIGTGIVPGEEAIEAEAVIGGPVSRVPLRATSGITAGALGDVVGPSARMPVRPTSDATASATDGAGPLARVPRRATTGITATATGEVAGPSARTPLRPTTTDATAAAGEQQWTSEGRGTSAAHRYRRPRLTMPVRP